MIAASNVKIFIHSRLGHEKAMQANIVESKSLQRNNRLDSYKKKKPAY